MFKVITLPTIVHVPRTVPVTPWPRVSLIKPRGPTWEVNLPSALNKIVSLTSPTIPCQSPTIFAAYCASLMVASSTGAQDNRLSASISPSRLRRSKQASGPAVGEDARRQQLEQVATAAWPPAANSSIHQQPDTFPACLIARPVPERLPTWLGANPSNDVIHPIAQP